MKTQNSEDHLDNEHYSNRLSPFLEKLQNELGAVHIDSQIKEVKKITS